MLALSYGLATTEGKILSPRYTHQLIPTRVIVSTTIFFIIALSLCTFRIYVRLRYFSFSWDDGFILAAMICGAGIYITGMISIAHGLGNHSNTLLAWELNKIACITLFETQLYVWAVTSIKISIALLLLRIREWSRSWKRGLTALMIFVASLAVACFVVAFTKCRPVHAIWDFSFPRWKCQSPKFQRIWGTTMSVLFLISDAILALLPAFFIRNIQCPRREKLVICLLMGLGLLCAATIIPKLLQWASHGNKRVDFAYTGARIYMWSALEVYWGIIAACAPSLKSVSEAALKRLGLLGRTTELNISRGRICPEMGATLTDGNDHPRGLKGNFAVLSRPLATKNDNLPWIELEGTESRDSPTRGGSGSGSQDNNTSLEVV
ncbi:hypothetical protein DM02DRAFT_663580 [Periconia macrospinosa]|uniref:Rhodopsin domain-containing protein n=1 Tax=Periconia macrospinosa TaxID=97972 RepID=A0A2V1D1C4_9PLEO|nr:hypothetical protein DM02DRAFT_663580 [Periconia macrospinosa]